MIIENIKNYKTKFFEDNNWNLQKFFWMLVRINNLVPLTIKIEKKYGIYYKI